MRKLLIALICAGSIFSVDALAKKNDILEFGVGLRMLLDSDVYAADNDGVNYASDTFPFTGDLGMGYGMNFAIGHQFDSRKGPWDFLVKYYYTFGVEDDGVRALGESATTSTITGKLSKHDILFAVRLPGTMLPFPILDHPNIYFDLGAGATTLSYKHDVEVAGTTVYDTTRDRTGLAFNLGMGYRHELSEDWEVTGRAEFLFSKIQDIETAGGTLIHESPNANALHLQIGLIRSFDSIF